METKNENGNTALMLAVKNDNFSIVKLLVTHGANINSVNKAKQSVLFIACYEGLLDCAKLLISKKANINLKDKRGWTPLMIAAYQGYEELVELLIDNGANVSLTDKFGKSAQDRAKTSAIFYTISSAAIEKRMKQVQEDYMSKMSTSVERASSARKSAHHESYSGIVQPPAKNYSTHRSSLTPFKRNNISMN